MRRAALRATSEQEARAALLEQGFEILELSADSNTAPFSNHLRLALVTLLALGLGSGIFRWSKAEKVAPTEAAGGDSYTFEIEGNLPPGSSPVDFIFPEVPLTLAQRREEVTHGGSQVLRAKFDLVLPSRPTKVLVRAEQQLSQESMLRSGETLSARVEFHDL